MKLHLKKDATHTWCGKDSRRVSLGVDQFYGRETCASCVRSAWLWRKSREREAGGE